MKYFIDPSADISSIYHILTDQRYRGLSLNGAWLMYRLEEIYQP